MNWFNSLKIKSRLLISFSIIIVFVLFLSVFVVIQMNTVDNSYNIVLDFSVEARAHIQTFADEANSLRRLGATLSTFAATDNGAAMVDRYYPEAVEAKATAEAALKSYDDLVNTNPNLKNDPSGRADRLAGTKNLLDLLNTYWNDTFVPVADATRANDHAKTINLMSSGAELASKLSAESESMIASVSTSMYNQKNGAKDKSFNTMVIVLVIAGVVVLASLLLALFISGDIAKDLKSIIDKLVSISSTVRSSADQINAASDNLATGSSKQAAAIEETSATMNETESMVAQNAENTRVAMQIATETTQAVSEAGEHMTSLMSTMNELKESSDKVSKIVKTIDDIAFQTNLLAINATVEAARAGGDAGRSFAVVAQEVRSLAQKSAQNSAETADIIEKNITLTNSSKDEAEQVRVIAEKNSRQTTDLGKLIAEISAASEEQASGIKQINIAISQMEKVTQENAAVAEENSAASGELHSEIITLDQAIEEASRLV